MASRTEKELTAERLIGLLLEEPKILEKILSSLKPEAQSYKHFKTVPEHKRVIFGKYSWSGFGAFWNNLIKCCDHISYDDLYVKVWEALLEMSSNPIVNEAIRNGLSQEVLLQGIHAGDQKILQRFFDVCRHLTDDGYWRDKGLDNNSAVHHHTKVRPSSDSEIKVEVTPQRQAANGFIKAVDSIGDVFEVFTGRWVGGRL